MSKLVYLHLVIVRPDTAPLQAINMYDTYVFDEGTLDALIKGVKQPILDEATRVGASISVTVRDIKVFDNELVSKDAPSVAQQMLTEAQVLQAQIEIINQQLADETVLANVRYNLKEAREALSMAIKRLAMRASEDIK